MDGRHNYLFSAIADKLAIEVEQVENFMLEGDQVSYCEPRLFDALSLMFVYVWGRIGIVKAEIILYLFVLL